MKKAIFCGLIATCLLAGSAIPSFAQNKRWEHNLYEGVGMAKKFDSHDNQGSPDKPGGLSIQLCKSEKKEFYIRYSS